VGTTKEMQKPGTPVKKKMSRGKTSQATQQKIRKLKEYRILTASYHLSSTTLICTDYCRRPVAAAFFPIKGEVMSCWGELPPKPNNGEVY
jgi:hypothetical protein